MAKIVNFDKYIEAMELLKEVNVINDEGEEVNLKFINIEFIGVNQAKRRKINEKDISMITTEKYGKEFVTLENKIINEKQNNEVIKAN